MNSDSLKDYWTLWYFFSIHIGFRINFVAFRTLQWKFQVQSSSNDHRKMIGCSSSEDRMIIEWLLEDRYISIGCSSYDHRIIVGLWSNDGRLIKMINGWSTKFLKDIMEEIILLAYLKYWYYHSSVENTSFNVKFDIPRLGKLKTYLLDRWEYIKAKI